MIHSLADMISNRWIINNIIEAELKPCYVYGIEVFLSSLIGITLLLLIGLLTDSLLKVLVFLAVFIPLRQFTGGYHADTYLQCNIQFVCVFLLNLFVSTILPDKLLPIIGIITILVGVIVILILAPVEHPNKEITYQEKKRSKIIALCMFIAEFAICTITFSINIDVSKTMTLTLLEIILLMIIGKIKVWRMSKNEKN